MSRPVAVTAKRAPERAGDPNAGRGVTAAGTTPTATSLAASIPRVGDAVKVVALPDLIINMTNGHQLAAALRMAQDGQTVRIDDGCYEIDEDVVINRYSC